MNNLYNNRKCTIENERHRTSHLTLEPKTDTIKSLN